MYILGISLQLTTHLLPEQIALSCSSKVGASNILRFDLFFSLHFFFAFLDLAMVHIRKKNKRQIAACCSRVPSEGSAVRRYPRNCQ